MNRRDFVKSTATALAAASLPGCISSTTDTLWTGGDPKELATTEQIMFMQELLGLIPDGEFGDQTRKALDTALLDIEARRPNFSFRRWSTQAPTNTDYVLIRQAVQTYGSAVFTNVEAIAKAAEINHQKAQAITTEYAAAMLGTEEDNLPRRLFEFKYALNQQTRVTVPLGSTLDPATKIALQYAQETDPDLLETKFPVHRGSLTGAQGMFFPDRSHGSMKTKKYHRPTVLNSMTKPTPVMRAVADVIIGNVTGRAEQIESLYVFVQSMDVSLRDYTALMEENIVHPIDTLRRGAGSVEDAMLLFTSLVRARGLATTGLVYVDFPDRLNTNPRLFSCIENDFAGSPLFYSLNRKTPELQRSVELQRFSNYIFADPASQEKDDLGESYAVRAWESGISGIVQERAKIYLVNGLTHNA